MKITQSIYHITFLTLLFAVFAGYNFMFADAPANPPANNTLPPINVGINAASNQNGDGTLAFDRLVGYNAVFSARFCDLTGTRCITPGVYDCPAGTAINQIRADGTVDCVSIGSVIPPPPAPVVTYSWSMVSLGCVKVNDSTKCGMPNGESRRTVTCRGSDGITYPDARCTAPKPSTVAGSCWTTSCSGDR